MHSDRCATVHAHLATGSHPDCAQFRFVQSGLRVLLAQQILEGLHIQHVQLEQVVQVLHAMEPPTTLFKRKSHYPQRLVKVELKSQEAGACAGPTSAGAGAALAATAAAREPPCLGCPSPPF